MAQVFISYSNHDRESVELLSRALEQAGYSVWIAHRSIGGAAQWPGEISKAIEECSLFIILLSENSVHSRNVQNELSLASERLKPILPIQISPLLLPHEVQFQLAGIQRLDAKDKFGILGAVASNLNLPNVATDTTNHSDSAPSRRQYFTVGSGILVVIALIYAFSISHDNKPNRAAQQAFRIGVLPVESISTRKDDSLLADGLTSQIINAVTPLAGIRVVDRATIRGLTRTSINAKRIVDTLNLDFLAESVLQRIGDSIKITVQLVDARTGKSILGEDYVDTNRNALALEVRLARMIAFELQGALYAARDSAFIWSKGSNNAPSIFIKGMSFFEPQDSASNEEALQHFRRSTTADPAFGLGYYFEGSCYLARYQDYGGNVRDLERADSVIHVLLTVEPATSYGHLALARIAGARGDSVKELYELREHSRAQPDDPAGPQSLANFYYRRNKFDLAANYFEKAAQKDLTDLDSWSALLSCIHTLDDTNGQIAWAPRAQPLFDRYLEKHPYDWVTRSQYALDLCLLGFRPQWKSETDKILRNGRLTGSVCMNLARGFAIVGDRKQAVSFITLASRDSLFVANLSEMPGSGTDFRNLETEEGYQEAMIVFKAGRKILPAHK